MREEKLFANLWGNVMWPMLQLCVAGLSLVYPKLAEGSKGLCVGVDWPALQPFDRLRVTATAPRTFHKFKNYKILNKQLS
jgi:hypothetical protein